MTKAPKPSKADLVPIDWERVEADFRAGVLSVREIGRIAGCSHTAINKRAEELGWERNLRAKILAKAEALVSKQAVSSEVAKTTEVATIAANAHLLANIALGQRRWADEALSVITAMLSELKSAINAPEVFGQVHDALLSGDDPDPALMRRLAELVTSLPEREKVGRGLMESLTSAIRLQRLTYSMDDKQKAIEEGDSFESLRDLAEGMP